MSHPFGFRAVLGPYYLALGTWFATTLMMGVAAGSMFVTARELNPRLPGASVTIMHHGEYLAGEAVNRGFAVMSTVHLICAAIVVVVLALQLTLWRGLLTGRVANLLRVTLLAVAVGVLVGDLAALRPKMNGLRATMYDEAVSPMDRQDARATFDALHKTSERMLGGVALAVAAALLVSPLAWGGARRESTVSGEGVKNGESRDG